MMPPIFGGSPFLPLITPRELAINATGRPSIAPWPQIISGADIGFRVDGVGADGKPIGRIVVHQKGEWIEVTLAGVGVRRLTVN